MPRSRPLYDCCHGLARDDAGEFGSVRSLRDLARAELLRRPVVITTLGTFLRRAQQEDCRPPDELRYEVLHQPGDE
eukprot:3718196-Amphidinium_carterae.1